MKRRISNIGLSVLGACLAFAIPTYAMAIAIDGSFDDWASVAGYGTTGSGVLSGVKLANDTDNLYVLYEYSASTVLDGRTQLFLDTRANGFNGGGWLGLGVDRLVEAGFLYEFTGADAGAWNWAQVGGYLGPLPDPVGAAPPEGEMIEFKIALSDLGLAGDSFKFFAGFSGAYSGASACGVGNWCDPAGFTYTLTKSQPVPEPGSLALVGGVLVAFGFLRLATRRKRA
jgi:hypothetical protein